MTSRTLHVGIVGAGLGGLTAAIAFRRAGVSKVTVLEASPQLSEIGAGIQMTPNVSRFLIEWGVAEVIGERLVEVEELSLRRKDGKVVGWKKMTERETGYPWWVVHRAHLHEGLVEIAKKHGAELLVNSRVADLDCSSSEKVLITTASGEVHIFDFVVGADGLNSAVRQSLFPDVKPVATTTNCAYRAVVPREKISQDPIAKDLIEKLTMDVWIDEGMYIIMYPISGGHEYNLVLSHQITDRLVEHVEEIDMSEIRERYKDFDPRIKRILDMVLRSQRWPLLEIGPLESWSSPGKNAVLMGDAAHSMVNHMAQGAATAMEDAAFLGRCLAEHSNLSLAEIVKIYEQERMPKALAKQHLSIINGEIWQVGDHAARKRDAAMRGELSGKFLERSPNLYADPRVVQSVYSYDAAKHADSAIKRYLGGHFTAEDNEPSFDDMRSMYIDWYMGKAKL